jgi:hypothetical protein
VLPFALAVGESPFAYFAGVGLWLAVLVIAVRRTRSWRHAVTVRSAQIEQRLERQAVWDRPEAKAARAKKAGDDAKRRAEERQFAIWDREKAADEVQRAMRKRYDETRKQP